MKFSKEYNPLEEKEEQNSVAGFNDSEQNATQIVPVINQDINNRVDAELQKDESKNIEFETNSQKRMNIKSRSNESIIRKFQSKELKISKRGRSEFCVRAQNQKTIKGRKMQVTSRRRKKLSAQMRRPPPLPSNVLAVIELFKHDSLLKYANCYFKPKI